MHSSIGLELLAPAKNEVVGRAAVNHGADAIYVGAPDFGARKLAANSLSDIERLIKYAHIYRSKVYIALNTILYDHELDQVQKLIYQLYNIGADAIIIQDMGILEMDLPPIPIHASTQANNFEKEQIVFFEKIGISRVVLARELSLNEIKVIRENTSIELEAFIHGALCVSLSGQCYLSQSIGERSANRGECAQACRLKYTLSNSEKKVLLQDKYLLSLKDLSVGDKIVKMATAGITSFKIEGRLKDEAYVKNVVGYYRQVIDKFINSDNMFHRESSGTIYPDFNPDIYKSFNRQFTTYFLSGRSKEMASVNSPKSFGEPLGEVIECKDRKLIVSTKSDFSNGDGLCYIGENEELKGIRVEKVEKDYLLISEPAKIKKGSLIYRNHNHTFLKQLNNSNGIRKIHCFVEVFENQDAIIIKATDEDNVTVKIVLPEAKEKAQKQELIVNMFKNQFLEAEDSYFRIVQFNWKVQSQIGFYRIAEANEFRRNLMKMLLEERIRSYQPKHIQFKISDSLFYAKKLDYRFNISNRLAIKFYTRHGTNVFENSPEITKNYIDKNLMTTRYCIKYEIGICEKRQLHVSNDNNDLFIENKFGKYKLTFDCNLCRMYVKKG